MPRELPPSVAALPARCWLTLEVLRLQRLQRTLAEAQAALDDFSVVRFWWRARHGWHPAEGER